MRTLLIGLLVGGISGFAIQRYVLESDNGSQYGHRTGTEESPVGVREREAPADSDRDELLARIRELEELLKKNDPDAVIDAFFADIEIPTTEEGIELLFEEFQATNDLDKFLALVRALLLQGERGYPKLTRLLLRMVGKVAAGTYREEEMFQKVVPAFKIAMRHEKELVGYVGYLMTDDGVPSMMRAPAMGAAMFLSINRVPGSERFAPLLLEAFMKQGAGRGRDEARMLIEAMGFLQQPEAVEPLLRILNDPSQQNMHYSAIEALARIGDDRAVGPLVARLNDPGRQEQWWSPEVSALAKLGTPEATAAAERFIASVTDDNRFFNHAGNFLRSRYSEKVVAMARERFRKNPAAGNLWGVVRGLNKAGTPESLAFVEEIARTATNTNAQRLAQRSLDERKRIADGVKDADR